MGDVTGKTGIFCFFYGLESFLQENKKGSWSEWRLLKRFHVILGSKKPHFQGKIKVP